MSGNAQGGGRVDSFLKALEAMENGQGLPLQPPTGEQNCPVGRIRIGIFFDGTGNNLWVDEAHANDTYGEDGGPNGPTNVARLFRAYRKQGIVLDKAYHHGVGTDYTGWVTRARPNMNDPAAKPSTPVVHRNLTGMTMGAGGKARIDWGLRMLAEFFSNNNKWRIREKYFDVCGFSRGAALARDFVNQVRAQRVANLTKRTSPGFFRRNPDAIPSIETQFQDLAIREFFEPIDPSTIYPKFMAIFDTVEMWGPGTGTFLPDVDHTYVEHCVHLVAEDEFRTLFPLTSIFMDPNTEPGRQFPPVERHRPARPRPDPRYQEPRDYKRWMLEAWYPGCHSDVGGSYQPRSNKRWHLQFITLRDMHKAMVKAQVPIGAVELPFDGIILRLYEEYCGFRQNKDWATHLEQPSAPKSQYVHWFESEEYMARFYGPDPHADDPYRGMSPIVAGLSQAGTGMAASHGVYVPPPTRPRWPERLLAITSRDSNPSYQLLLRHYIHDSATESPGSTILGEATDRRGRQRLQRKVIPAGAQPQWTRNIPVRNQHRPPRSTY
ncbi:DUF2235 domain-containing protein [Polyangium sp. y55x31]|uniref:T6SS phospholipase effector Tle1-like catalytic domain-containing protein n=1 Tax=Polyangium sp. y55x31 TaxID=3042688 RepID=UPI002482A57A|nr:DUF2235 domain-containing protein [Polyangium sp. y55x31]MDI1480059.1 DUF2235 domain-containing protein [Polyangium sp. y55x31]